jgi:Fic family protein
MKIPFSPPKHTELLKQVLAKSDERLVDVFSMGISADSGGDYYHWDKLRHLKTPNGLDHHEWWLGIKTARKSLYKYLPHKDKSGVSFVYSEPDVVRKLLHEIDLHGGGEIKSVEQVANPHTRDAYLINSLIEESITSSQLEGAATTRKVAKEMLREKRKPKNRSERMILNNFYGMQFINDISDQKLTPEMIFELHRILSEGTLENPEAVGKLRTADDIYVGDNRDATIIHVPPKAAELADRIKSICRFANAEVDDPVFLHPVIRAIVLHFLLAYDHPFEDGNGRTARALFYWSMLRQGYWTMEYVSISSILKKSPAKYVRAYLYTETDENDVTYFIVHQLNTITKAIKELFKYLKKKADEVKDIDGVVRKSQRLQKLLNYRQTALINRALRKPGSVFYIESHRGSHNVTYDTARTDLLKLVDAGLLVKEKLGKAYVFRPVNDLEQSLKSMADE